MIATLRDLYIADPKLEPLADKVLEGRAPVVRGGHDPFQDA